MNFHLFQLITFVINTIDDCSLPFSLLRSVEPKPKNDIRHTVSIFSNIVNVVGHLVVLYLL